MAWDFDSGRPIYTQLVEIFKQQIASGKYPPGSKLPSVRELAAEAAVNPNTMQRALAQLEGEGLVVTLRTSGRMVTEDAERIDALRRGLAEGLADTFFSGMKELGYDDQQIRELLQQMIGRGGQI